MLHCVYAAMVDQVFLTVGSSSIVFIRVTGKTMLKSSDADTRFLTSFGYSCSVLDLSKQSKTEKTASKHRVT